MPRVIPWPILLLPALLAAFIASIVLTRVVIWASQRLRFLDQPGAEAHKQQTQAVPYGGGVAMVLAMLLGLALAPRHIPGLLDPNLDHARIPPVLFGALALALVGLLDDWRPLPAFTKLIAQGVVAAVVIPLGDLTIDSLAHWHILGFVITWLWLVLVTNAYNLLDHADGLSASVGVVSCAVLMGGSLLNHDLPLAALWAMQISVMTGFLIWNLPPARIYMGDCGSLPLGFLIAAGTLSVTFWPSGMPSVSPLAWFGPLIITAIPLFDAMVVVLKRVLNGKPVFKGDRNHMGHRLTQLGYSPRSSLAVVVALQVALAGSAFTLRLGDQVSAIIVLAQDAAIFVAVIVLETVRARHA